MKKNAHLLFFLVLSISYSLVLFSQEEQKAFVNEYIIGPRDLLEIKVFELPEFNQTVRVSEDGSITIPLLGKVIVGGLTKDDIEKKISGLLDEKYVKNARVSVFIREYQSKLVSVIGAVIMPGMYELIGRRTLLQVISLAGGFKATVGDNLFVLREGDNGITATLSIDLKDLLENGNQILNIPLQANDVINVPVDEIINIYVFGSVRSPGALGVKTSKKITLLQAIAQAGGTSDGAKKSGVLIKRKDKNGKEIKIKVNLKDIINGNKPDIELKEGDVVYVPESIW